MLLIDRVAVVLILFTFAFSPSSKEDENIIPAYVGTWQEETFEVFAPALKVAPLVLSRTILVLEEASYNKVVEGKATNSVDWRTEYGEKGSVSISGNVITRKSLQGAVDLDQSNLDKTVVKYVNLTEDERVTYVTQWSVVNNKLTLILDTDDNGKFDDPTDYLVTYTKL